MIICPKCDGKREYDVLNKAMVNCRTISPPYKKETCDRCDGIGEIKSDEIINSSVEVKLKDGAVVVSYEAELWGEDGVRVGFDGGDIENPDGAKIDNFIANDIRKAVYTDAKNKLTGVLQ